MTGVALLCVGGPLDGKMARKDDPCWQFAQTEMIPIEKWEKLNKGRKIPVASVQIVYHRYEYHREAGGRAVWKYTRRD